MNKRVVIIAVCLLANALVSGTSRAQESDGICDILIGATPGLHSLCVKFCEVKQCEPDFSLEDPFVDCPRRCERLFEKYEEKRTVNDPDMPCVEEGPCPCWTLSDLAASFPPEGAETIQCMASFNFYGLDPEPERYRIQIGMAYQDGSWTTCETWFDPDGDKECRIRTWYPGWDNWVNLERQLNVRQHFACRELIARFANDQSIRCFY